MDTSIPLSDRSIVLVEDIVDTGLTLSTLRRMLEARGTADFNLLSEELYGSASDVFHAGDPTLADLGTQMEATLINLLKPV